jgi:hypothetical protein
MDDRLINRPGSGVASASAAHPIVRDRLAQAAPHGLSIPMIRSAADTVSSIESIDDLLKIVEDWETRFAKQSQAFPSIWYRGLAEFDWELRPFVERADFLRTITQRAPPTAHEIHDREVIINVEFRRRASFLLDRGLTDLDVYFLAQHHGLPTRLLDWTRNPLAAVFFAVNDCRDRDGGLYVVEPTFFADQTHRSEPLFDMNDQRIVQTIEHLFGKRSSLQMQPQIVPLYPDLSLGRMHRQDSAFTLHMPGAAPIDEAHQSVAKYLVPAAAKDPLLRTLRRLGVSWANLFPDLDHLAKEMRVAWRIESR